MIVPGRGREVPVRVLGVDAALDGVTADPDVVLLAAQGLARGDADLLLDEVDAGDQLRDGVLHLDAGVHLDEVELLALDEELDGAGAVVADRLARASPRRGPSCVRRSGVMPGLGLSSTTFWWRRCTEQSRSPRWIDVALLIAEDLDLDVARVREVLLDVDRRVAEGGLRLGPGGRPGCAGARCRCGRRACRGRRRR